MFKIKNKDSKTTFMEVSFSVFFVTFIRIFAHGEEDGILRYISDTGEVRLLFLFSFSRPQTCLSG